MAKKVKKIKKEVKPAANIKKTVKKTTRTQIGVVVGNKAQKTLRVRVETKFAHPLYTKIVKIHRNYLVHSNEQVEVGKTVRFKEVKPISKSKKWILVDVLNSKK